jgi:hypothetical protein
VTHLATYDPEQDAAERYPDWMIIAAGTQDGTGELLDHDMHVWLVDPKYVGDRQAMAHAIAHLDLGHHETDAAELTDQQCSDADGLALLRLDELPHDWR